MPCVLAPHITGGGSAFSTLWLMVIMLRSLLLAYVSWSIRSGLVVISTPETYVFVVDTVILNTTFRLSVLMIFLNLVCLGYETSHVLTCRTNTSRTERTRHVQNGVFWINIMLKKQQALARRFVRDDLFEVLIYKMLCHKWSNLVASWSFRYSKMSTWTEKS